MQRRWSLWQEMMGTQAWGDFTGQIVKARDGIIQDLIVGTPNRYKERGDDEKRAMIHVLNVVLDTPLAVERDARHAVEAMRRYHERVNAR